MKTGRRKRGLLDTALVLALLYGVYAATPVGTLAETGVRWLSGQKYLPPLMETFRGKDTRVNIETFRLPEIRKAEPVSSEPENRPEAENVEQAALLGALLRAHGICDKGRDDGRVGP